jgi:peptide/nickel transport system permease protein
LPEDSLIRGSGKLTQMEHESLQKLADKVVEDHRKMRLFQLRQFINQRSAVLALCVLTITVIAALLGPLIAPYPEQGMGEVNVSERLQGPSSSHLLGTDIYGRDILSRIVCGARVSVFGGMFIVLSAALIGVPLGLWAGYSEGIPGAVITRLVELFLSFPSVLIAMAISIVVGAGPFTALIALVIPWWPWYARLVMGEVLSKKRLLYVEAAQMLGYGRVYIMLRHLLPNVLTPVIVMILLDLGPAIIAIGLLSFLGLGTQPPQADWGLMVWEGAQNILSEWWIAIVPGCAMFIVVTAFNIFGDAVKDILSPN